MTRGTKSPAGNAFQAVLEHQPGDTLSTDAATLRAQFFVRARTRGGNASLTINPFIPSAYGITNGARWSVR
jgi:hypothetical protein